ncbi:MAG: serine hydroxymethyltransferase, partial [Phycisphaerales bacterium JB065]
RPPMKTSGLRLGTPALTTRGFKEEQMKTVAGFIDRVLESKGDESVAKQVRDEIRELCERFPLPNSEAVTPA